MLFRSHKILGAGSLSPPALEPYYLFRYYPIAFRYASNLSSGMIELRIEYKDSRPNLLARCRAEKASMHSVRYPNGHDYYTIYYDDNVLEFPADVVKRLEIGTL